MHIIEVTQKKGLNYAKHNGRVWNSKGRKQDIGDLVMEILWYCNKENNQIQIIINGVDETIDFRKQAIERYHDSFFKYFLNNIGV